MIKDIVINNRLSRISKGRTMKDKKSETTPKNSNSRKKQIKKIIKKNKARIKTVDDDFFGDVVGVAQAIGQLKEALKKVNVCLDQREFEKASDLGYSDVSSEFIFLQRCLGGLNDSVMQKEIIIQDICVELCNDLDNVRNEEVAPLVEREIKSLKPRNTPMKIEVVLGKKTTEKLQALESIRHTPIEHLAELILASAMKNDESTWQKLENSKPPVAHIRDKEKEFYSSDEVSKHIKTLGKQEKERVKNLY